jgi:hypothetical protein
MKTQLPPNYRPPTWATKEFRRLLIVGVMGCAVIGVLVFDIAPKFSQKYVPAAKEVDLNAFVPKPPAPGEVREVKYAGVLEKVKDGTPIDDQDEPYKYLVRALARQDAAALAKDAKPVEYQYYSKLPAELRGHTIKIQALFLASNPIRVEGAPGGVNFIHRTYLMDSIRGNQGFVVDLQEPPGDLPSKTVVALDAVFLKLGTYEGKLGPVQAPLLLGKSLQVRSERLAAGPVSKLSSGVIVGGGLVTMLTLLFLTSRMFKKSGPTLPKRTEGQTPSLETLKT